MPEELRVEFALLQKVSGVKQVTYQEFFNHLDMRFGSMPTTTARAVWTDVRLEVDGKITPAKFNSFRVAFLSAMLDVKDATADEATRVLLGKFANYPGVMNWINRAESKEGEHHPAFEVSFGMPPPVPGNVSPRVPGQNRCVPTYFGKSSTRCVGGESPH